MTTLLFVMPWVATVCGAVMIGKALRLWEISPQGGENRKRMAILASPRSHFRRSFGRHRISRPPSNRATRQSCISAARSRRSASSPPASP